MKCLLQYLCCERYDQPRDRGPCWAWVLIVGGLRNCSIVLTTPGTIRAQLTSYFKARDTTRKGSKARAPKNGWPLIGVAPPKSKGGRITDTGLPTSWLYLVLDGANSIKNREAKMPRSLAWIMAQYRVAVSGTRRLRVNIYRRSNTLTFCSPSRHKPGAAIRYDIPRSLRRSCNDPNLDLCTPHPATSTGIADYPKIMPTNEQDSYALLC